MDYALLGKEPVPGDKPTGNDCRYEESFESLQAEIDKMSSPSASGQVDWSIVVKQGATILAEQSKDLTVASYLAVGLLHTRQVNGLDDGLQVLRDLVENYWDKLYPSKKRMRGRLSAIKWWMEKSEEVLESLNPKPIPEELAQRCQDNLKSLDEQLVDKMPDPPLLRPIQRLIDRIPVIKPEPPAAEEESQEPAATPESRPAETTAAAPKAAPATPSAPGTIGDAKDANRTAGAAFRQLNGVAHFFLNQDTKEPLAYRYRRMAAWSQVVSPPPDTDGETMVPPPQSHLSTTIEQQRDEANWPAVIQLTESSLPTYVFWLDLSFWTAEALKNLGGDHMPALKVVEQETATLLQRLPGLTELTFADGTPFADSDTRQWLGTLQAADPAPQQGAQARPDDGGEHYQELVQKALAMARKKKVVDAVALLQAQMAQATSRQLSMRWRLAISKVLITVKRFDGALAHLEKILGDIEMFNLEEWDPDLALEGLTAAWKAYSAQKVPELQTQATQILNRIAGIDPAEALRLGK